MKKRGAYKITHIRIINDPPPVDYDELTRLQLRYTLDALTYQIDKLNKQKANLKKKLKRLQEQTNEPIQ